MQYFYQAKNLRGEKESGSMSAGSEKELSELLRKQGYFLISASLSPDGNKKGLRAVLNKINVLQRLISSVTLAEKIFFTRNLTVMIRSGVSLPRAFEVLSRQAKSKKFKRTLKIVSSKVVKGESLSSALGSFPKIFPRLYHETVRVGEETGKLDEVLAMLAEQMERRHKLISNIKTAMTYPLLVLGLALGIGVFMFIFAVPQLKTAFEDLNVNLPFTTRAIFALGDFLSKKWPIALVLVLVLVLAVALLIKTKKGGKYKAMFLFKVPIVSKIIKQTNSVLVLRTLGSLMGAGVPVVKALKLTAGALSNYYFRKSLLESAAVVEKGKRVSLSLKPYENLYSPMVLEMLEVGEETGETAAVLEQLANFYEEEVTNATQKLSSTIEPFLLMLVGGGVGFFAISMMQPMFSIMGSIN